MIDKNITDFLSDYTKKGILRMHMPGHKSKSLTAELANAYAWDITEIHGADSLFASNGIIRQAEQQTADIYHTGGCCWSAGGSTLCIQAMLAQMKAEHRYIIASRTVHRAFLNACILLHLPVRWVFPVSGGIIAGKYDLMDFEKALQEAAVKNKLACIYVTSPDYTGNLQDIAGLAELCRKYHAKLLVDNAHGAHLAFLRQSQHPMDLGADYCCDSAHKTLPALTGGAFLHMKNKSDTDLMKQHMQLFGSTSPSYLIMQSLEACTVWLLSHGREAIQLCAQRAERLKQELSDTYPFMGSDPMHLTLKVNGCQTADILRKNYQIECEYADKTCLVLLLSPMLSEDDFLKLECALKACKPIPAEEIPALPEPMQTACSMREAALSAYEIVDIAQAADRICASVQVSCPPAVPIAVSGERLSGDWLDFMQFYGLQKIAVLP